MPQTYYEILEIDENSTQQDIRKAYVRLIKQAHPDVNATQAQANERTRQIIEAYNTLKNEKSRRHHDLRLPDQAAPTPSRTVEFTESQSPSETSTAFHDHHRHYRRIPVKIVALAFAAIGILVAVGLIANARQSARNRNAIEEIRQRVLVKANGDVTKLSNAMAQVGPGYANYLSLQSDKDSISNDLAIADWSTVGSAEAAEVTLSMADLTADNDLKQANSSVDKVNQPAPHGSIPKSQPSVDQNQ